MVILNNCPKNLSLDQFIDHFVFPFLFCTWFSKWLCGSLSDIGMSTPKMCAFVGLCKSMHIYARV